MIITFLWYIIILSTAIYSRGNGSVPKIFYQFICSHEPIHLRCLTNYLQLRVFDCFWSLPASGHFLSLVTSCLWSLPASGHFLSLVTSCLWSLPVSGHFLHLVTSCLWSLPALGHFLLLVTWLTFCLWSLPASSIIYTISYQSSSI
jgi:hypothetical protein